MFRLASPLGLKFIAHDPYADPDVVAELGIELVGLEDVFRSADYLTINCPLAALILICTPIFLPIVKDLGMDPAQFGIMLMMNLGLGLCTPPVGACLFVGCAVGKVPIEDALKTIWPFYLAILAALLLVTYVPAISLTLPQPERQLRGGQRPRRLQPRRAEQAQTGIRTIAIRILAPVPARPATPRNPNRLAIAAIARSINIHLIMGHLI